MSTSEIKELKYGFVLSLYRIHVPETPQSNKRRVAGHINFHLKNIDLDEDEAYFNAMI
jgi:hypothetical protein